MGNTFLGKMKIVNLKEIAVHMDTEIQYWDIEQLNTKYLTELNSVHI